MVAPAMNLTSACYEGNPRLRQGLPQGALSAALRASTPQGRAAHPVTAAFRRPLEDPSETFREELQFTGGSPPLPDRTPPAPRPSRAPG
ncbi:hypothetical protein Shyd_91340 [Streptomyces hydrogenans]|uniref:Uncharacterized protein n=1 Tax=Streptomyces hydrogenans TaxID=1873719 RepID=A0ABQ3PRV4_9ACTN|nr:hypothetical protein GCM10018784_19000 [Streptomyces hydrogenans]GHI27763.1 hypothetical protein Shyd_91340 [Streptomyces hydrogenans]